MNLYPIVDNFLNFTLLCNDFAVNAVKFLYGESDLQIFEMR
jgi:hypothetical protein